MYVRELTRRRYRGKKPVLIRGPEDVAKLLPRMKRLEREHFLVVLLNARHEVEAVETVSVGSLNASIVHPREVFKPAILASAASVVLVHNHPSGDPTPSLADIDMTKKIIQAGEKLGVLVHDHLIIGKKDHVSFRSLQLI